jgi:[ribosomal protein S5]-alanine N-acetyltransferase
MAVLEAHGAPHVKLEDPCESRMREFLDAARRSEALHAAWVAPPRTEREYAEYLQRIHRSTHVGYFLCNMDGEIVGVANLGEIVRASFQSAYLGYYAFAPHQGQGYMSAGLRMVLGQAFGEQQLHRVEANIQPSNERSLRLVRQLGFRREGFSLRYLKIAGQWRDHERWAITCEEWA